MDTRSRLEQLSAELRQKIYRYVMIEDDTSFVIKDVLEYIFELFTFCLIDDERLCRTILRAFYQQIGPWKKRVKHIIISHFTIDGFVNDVILKPKLTFKLYWTDDLETSSSRWTRDIHEAIAGDTAMALRAKFSEFLVKRIKMKGVKDMGNMPYQWTRD
ncbi:hypothetical protein P154DRAFT_578864 [Amniculicola lignicola CBS 123094]|uniref:Uncharacterized protein n=1 Tax=Amniculicola lignicola CBS 123094 TaxID=1392246 RepID=A0A6A5W6C4_9PLEO|nr:hypothetical protein P154DRAFT_578864 [Amniculicola lignicola CBS 123094]